MRCLTFFSASRGNYFSDVHASPGCYIPSPPFGKVIEEALHIAEKRREVKGKGEKERCTHLNAEFQRIARRDKKAFFSDQCKETEESNRMGKIRDLFKKTGDTKEHFMQIWAR